MIHGSSRRFRCGLIRVSAIREENHELVKHSAARGRPYSQGYGDARTHGPSMYSMACDVDAFDSSRPGPWPITLPRDSRGDSEHKKQYRDGSLRVVRIAGWLPR